MSDKVQITIKNKVGEKYADLQTKIVTPSKETQVITADEGYYGLREVIVGANAIDGDLLANEINDMKESLTQGDATPEDIKLGKIAYVNGKKVVGTYKTPTTLKALLDYTKSCRNMFLEQRSIKDLTDYIAFEDTENVEVWYRAFSNCNNLTNISLNTASGTNFMQMFYNDNKLVSVSLSDFSKAIGCSDIFNGCSSLEELTMKTIKINLQVGSSNRYGHLLTLDSLLGLCQECVNVNDSRTLTVGTTNINKLANVYVKLTNQPEEDETLPKIPMVQCESTDEGAMTIDAYMALKNWKIA